jgi:hypothetical protein
VTTVLRPRRVGKKWVTDTYRTVNQVPLRNSDDALRVNGCELISADAYGDVLFRNAWATSHPITADNVVALAGHGVKDRKREQQYAQNQGVSLRAQLRPW